ncbi:hypothetical protein HHX47_DHR1000771 [Lentinula edodes]|nr:hypothetical protein HHX47_DHR1000771 [Lentinula edodes]
MATKSNYGWLQGRTVRKGGHSSSNSHTRSSTPQVQSTSTTIFGGGIKDPSGRTSEYFYRFNKRLEDFDDLRSYNDYLEEVEDIAFNLINNIDILATEARIAAYKAANAALTSLNLQREEAEALALKEQEDLERREREARAAQLAQQEQQERDERQREERELIDKLETSQKDAHKIVAKSRIAAAKRSSARAASSSANSGLLGMSFGADYAKLLKTRTNKVTNNVPDEPHVPFQDDWYAYDDLYTVRVDGYDDIISEAVRKDREGIMRAGGYKVEEAWNRALLTAVAGLNIVPLSGSDEPKSLGDADVVMDSV